MGFPKRLENPFYLHYLHSSPLPWRGIDARPLLLRLCFHLHRRGRRRHRRQLDLLRVLSLCQIQTEPGKNIGDHRDKPLV